MSTNSIIVLVLLTVIVVIALVAVATYFSSKRSKHLRDRFGPEYARLAEETGSKSAAEKQLEAREKRAAKFLIRPLTEEDSRRFSSQWQQVQAEFVDDPKASLIHADDLLGTVMVARGYPMSDFAQRTADLSVDHATVVQHYHAAHGIALAHRRGEATTEDMRQAMIHYRSLFDELVSEVAQAHAAE
jgi:FtsZ-interacting cell division protein ZipA